MYKKLVWVLAIILLVLLGDRFILTPNDIKIDMKPEVLRASTSSELIINVYRTNLLGFKVPFSKIDTQFIIEDGKNLIELIGEQTGNNITVRSKGIEGEATLGIYSLKSGNADKENPDKNTAPGCGFELDHACIGAGLLLAK